MKKNLLSISLTLIVVKSFAATINIPADFPTIQQGIDTANIGDTILVQSGTYLENINYHGKNVIVASLYLTTGDTGYISSTIIYHSPLSTLNGSIVTFENGETQAAQLIGFTLMAGTGNFRQIGLDHVYYGGGIYCYNASPALSHLKIISNTAECGGGIFLYNSNSVIENCTIANNICNSISFSAPDAGGGIVCWNCANTIITNCKIVDNTVSTAGAGIYTLTSNLYVINCLVANNYSMNSGAAFYSDSWSNFNITNCTVYGNHCDFGTGIVGASMMYCIDSSHVQISNSIFWGNKPATIVFQQNYSHSDVTVSHTDFEGGIDSIISNGNATINWLNGNINTYPMFVDTALTDVHLQNNSMCINTGDTTGISNIPLFDLDNNNRFVGIIDMGCYENQTATGIINYTLNNLFIYAYPNPFENELTINGIDKETEIILYDVLSKQVFQQTFSSLTTINTEQLAKGIYIYKVKNKGETLANGKVIKQ